MKESVAIAKEANRKQGSSPNKSDNSIQHLRNEPERQLGALRDVIGNIRRNGDTPSVESVATELSVMPSSNRASALLALQQTHGNRYVQRMVTGIQAKLKVGQPGDKYEQEADRVAEQVMRMPEPQVQRQVEPEEEEEEEFLQTKPLAEQITTLVQRQVEEEEEEILQTKENPGQTPGVIPDLEARIQFLRGSGQPLPEANRGFMERRFGIDFSGVRLHTDSDAAQMSRELNAEAFTYGRDIYFGEGRYNPGTSSSRRLLAHELAHVVQQDKNRRSLSREKPTVVRLYSHIPLIIQKTNGSKSLTWTAWLWSSDGLEYNKLRSRLEGAKYKFITHVKNEEGKWEKKFPTSKTPANQIGWSIGTPDGKWKGATTANVVAMCRTLIVTPQYCGPDSTQWLVDQMNRNRNHPVIKTQREVQWPNWIPVFNIGWNYGALSDFRDLVKAGAPWDFKSNQKQWRSGPGKTCPTAQCDKTVFLCGKCFFYDVPGNIHYGYIGRMASIRAWFLHNRAAAAQKGGKDPTHDTAAIDIGIAMADQDATLCGEIAAHESELNREGTKGCGLCPEGTGQDTIGTSEL